MPPRLGAPAGTPPLMPLLQQLTAAMLRPDAMGNGDMLHARKSFLDNALGVAGNMLGRMGLQARARHACCLRMHIAACACCRRYNAHWVQRTTCRAASSWDVC